MHYHIIELSNYHISLSNFVEYLNRRFTEDDPFFKRFVQETFFVQVM